MRFFATARTTYLLVFDTGDEALTMLQRFIADHSIPSAYFHAIGAFESSNIAYWNRDTKEYEEIPVAEQVEVLSLSGNASPKKVHGHVVLGRRDGSTIGGHLRNGIVHPTLEMYVTLFDHELVRKRDEATGLDLIR